MTKDEYSEMSFPNPKHVVDIARGGVTQAHRYNMEVGHIACAAAPRSDVIIWKCSFSRYDAENVSFDVGAHGPLCPRNSTITMSKGMLLLSEDLDLRSPPQFDELPQSPPRTVR